MDPASMLHLHPVPPFLSCHVHPLEPLILVGKLRFMRLQKHPIVKIPSNLIVSRPELRERETYRSKSESPEVGGGAISMMT